MNEGSAPVTGSLREDTDMTVNLDLPSNVEQAYLVMAQARGLTLADVVRDVLIAARPATAGECLALEPEGWVRKFQV